MKPLRKSIFLYEDKDQLSFCQKPCWKAERSNHLFLSNWWIAFFKHLYSLILWQYTEINWLCEHRKKVRSSQACISINSCTELSKTKFSLWVLLSQSKCSLEPKTFLRGLCPLNTLLRGSDPPALLMLTTLHFLLLMFPAGYDIHPGHTKMACD